jgi:hypothetical protein
MRGCSLSRLASRLASRLYAHQPRVLKLYDKLSMHRAKLIEWSKVALRRRSSIEMGTTRGSCVFTGLVRSAWLHYSSLCFVPGQNIELVLKEDSC